MEDTGGVVHHTVGVDRGTELFFAEALADAVGKAGANEEHFLAWLYLEAGLRYIDNGTELQGFTIYYLLASRDLQAFL